jgi:hypothetical protein
MRVAIVALMFVVACGSAGGQDSTPLAAPSPPTAALAAWKDFPANGNPRPIVWFGDVYEHVDGFSTNDGKINWVCAKFVLGPGVGFPAAGTASATARWPSGMAASFGSIGAETAFAGMLQARVSGTGSDCATAKPEVITAVRWGTAGFATDRGTAQMSAWLFDVGAVNGELGYPALDPSAYWGRGKAQMSGGAGGLAGIAGVGGRISPDGLTLTIGLIGGPETPGPCGEDFAASAAESDTAVAVAISSRIHGGADAVCTLVGYARSVQVHLAKPLGGRVLVDAQGNAQAVCPKQPGAARQTLVRSKGRALGAQPAPEAPAIQGASPAKSPLKRFGAGDGGCRPWYQSPR